MKTQVEAKQRSAVEVDAFGVSVERARTTNTNKASRNFSFSSAADCFPLDSWRILKPIECGWELHFCAKASCTHARRLGLRR